MSLNSISHLIFVTVTNCLLFEVRTEVALMMEAVRTSESSVNFNVTTRRYIPEDSKLHTRRRENLKSHRSSEY
jgi:hypothetical protein